MTTTTTNSTTLPRAYTVEQAAEHIGVSRAMIYQMVRSGVLKSIRLGRRRFIPEAEMLRILTEGTESNVTQQNSGASRTETRG